MKYPRQLGDFIIKHTGPKGYGLFAATKRKKGEILFKAEGTVIHHTDKRLTHRGVQISKTRFIEPFRFSLVWYMNHSCNPNAYVDHDTIIAKRPIANGDEITADYSLFTHYPNWDMECACGHKTCRKLIVSYDKLDNRLRSTKHVSGYLKGEATKHVRT